MAAPTLILFLVDQLAAKWLEVADSGACPTPHLDALRAEGTTFSRCFSSNPVCMPARATLATGLAARGHGVLQNGYALNPEHWTFMRALQEAGWRTGAFGKVHLQPHYKTLHPDYRPYGFDHCRITEDPRPGDWLDWVLAEHPQHAEAALATVFLPWHPEYAAYGPDRIDLRHRIAQAQARGLLASDAPDCYLLPFPEPVSQSGWITSEALGFVEAADRERPLFMQVSHVSPHSPFCPPADCMDCVDTERIPEPVDPEWLDDPVLAAHFDTSEGVRRERHPAWRRYRQHYFAELHHLDACLGRLVDGLKASGRWEATTLVFTSDHGELLMDHGFSGKAERHYDASVRVPLIIRTPGGAGGRTCDAFVRLEDVAPTCLDAAGIAPPAHPTVRPDAPPLPPPLAGDSLLPVVRGGLPLPDRDQVYIESYNNLFKTSVDDWARTIRTATARYTLYPRGHGEQLFLLDEDPDETVNRAMEPACAGLRREMRDRLLEAVILQDYPHPRRDLYGIDVH